MASSSNGNVLCIDISIKKMTTPSEKKYKTGQLKEIFSAICALLNSRGGTLTLKCTDTATATLQKINVCARTIEQRVNEMLGTMTMTNHIKMQVSKEFIIINITESPKLITVKYNLYLPSKTQVNAIQATTSAEEIKGIFKNRFVDNCVIINSHMKEFKKGKNAVLEEGDDVQLKNLKSGSSDSKVQSKSTSLADRITGSNNKFTFYVSAFANHRGGHIYYGISDDGTVEGEEVKDENKDEIIKKVGKAIKKMIWPQGESQRGAQWEIFFEPVVDDDNKPISSTFVIAIYIAPCPEGVFTEKPESYTNVEGKVTETSFKDWRCSLIGSKSHPSSHDVQRPSWSTKGNEEQFCKLSEKLVDHRDAGDMDAYNKLCELAITKFPGSNAELTVKAGQVTMAYKQHRFPEARSLLEQFEELLSSSKDNSIFEVRFLLSKCLVARSEGDHKVGYEIAKDGLQLMENIPVGLCMLWLYLEAGMNASCISFEKQGDTEQYHSLKSEALQNLEMAAGVATELEVLKIPFRMDDFQHKLRIYKAWILLNCSVTGDVAQDVTPSTEDIEAAAEQLQSVSGSKLRGKSLTHFRKIEYHLAKCDIFRRRFEVLHEDYNGNLRQAREFGLKAQALAKEHNFKNLFAYANRRLDSLECLEDKLALNEEYVRETEVRTFMGCPY